ALGGGGGTGYVYLGCFEILEEWGLSPALIAGTSIGAILGLFRARRERYAATDVAQILSQLSYRKMFRLSRMASRYAIPGPFRLYLRGPLGRHLLEPAPGAAASPSAADPNPPPLPLGRLQLPFVVAVSGVSGSSLPRPLEAYEQLFDPRSLFPPTPRLLRRKALDIVAALAELVLQPHRLRPLYLGLDPGTLEIDCLDACGFSSSLPGVLHYDVWRDEPEVHERLGRLLRERELGWLADGGLVENCPMRAAFLGVRERVQSRNAFVLGLDGFSPKLSTPAWLPLERLAQENVRRVLPFGSLHLPFERTLSPLELVPGVGQAQRAVALGRARLAPELPFLSRMLATLPRLEECRPAGATSPS
ncbi:MAG: patatin-like phospholipase family protein, partial [Deltaproteobacteria bacterium]